MINISRGLGVGQSHLRGSRLLCAKQAVAGGRDGDGEGVKDPLIGGCGIEVEFSLPAGLLLLQVRGRGS